MKKTFFVLMLAATTTALVSCNDTPQEDQLTQTVEKTTESIKEDTAAKQDTIKGSIPSEAVGRIGDTNIKINYYAPGVKGRIIWGGLVPFDRVWATGAHMATAVEFDQNLLIGDQEVPAGKYALFTIPGKGVWTVILNNNWQQHLTDEYDQKDDVIRVSVKPEETNQHQERLRYTINSTSATEGTIDISWDKIRVPVKVQSEN